MASPDSLAQRLAALRQGAPRTAAARPAPVAPPWQVDVGDGRNLILMPGQMAFGGGATQLRTLLGSCVSLTLWHPGRRLGGMCHYMLPQRPRRGPEPPDGRYGDEAVEQMVHALRRAGTRPEEYVAHLYGGADTMPDGSTARFNVGARNIEQGWNLIDRWGFQLEGVDVGENIPRTVIIELASGEVSMRRGTGPAPTNAALAHGGSGARSGALR